VKRSIIRSLCASSVALLTLLVTAAAALAIDEFTVPTPGSNPAGLTAGPDASLWFTEEATSANKIGRITTAGVFTAEIVAPTPAPPPITGPPETGPSEIALGPDGRLWFTEIGASRIGRHDPVTGQTVDFVVPGSSSAPDGIVAGPDGRMWFTQSGSAQIGAITTNGVVSEYGFTGSNPSDITVGPDGALWFTQNSGIGRIETDGSPITAPTAGVEPSGIAASGASLWFTDKGANKIVRISTAGVVTGDFPVPTPGSGLSGIALGVDNALWFTETDVNRIGRMTTSGALTNEFVIPTPGSQPGAIASGPDGALWFAEFAANKIGRIATSTGAPPPLPPPPPPPPVTSTKKKCKVPKLRGLTVKKARRKLKRAKCKYRIRGKGRVRSTVPKAGRTTTKRVTVKCKRKKAKRSGRRATAGGRLIASKGGLQ
jgi:virginiamycin B lyase